MNPTYRRRSLLTALLSMALLSTPVLAADAPPSWLYPVPPKDYKPELADSAVVKLPGSKASYTAGQLRDNFVTGDWYPEEHPTMPDVVKQGRKPSVFACAHCHRTSGQGGPENATIAGMPHDYIVRQLKDYRSGARSTAVPGRGPQSGMIQTAKNLSDAEIESAARYFSSLKPAKRVRVQESATIPKVEAGSWILVKAAGKATEPLGRRIVELPDDLGKFEARDPRMTFTAYVPPGSVAKGETLAKTGSGGKTIPCLACHGPNLKGLGDAPPIAGRSPSSMLRQLHEFKTGVRHGEKADQMKAVVAKLTLDDMIDLVAYLTTQEP